MGRSLSPNERSEKERGRKLKNTSVVAGSPDRSTPSNERGKGGVGGLKKRFKISVPEEVRRSLSPNERSEKERGRKLKNTSVVAGSPDRSTPSNERGKGGVGGLKKRFKSFSPRGNRKQVEENNPQSQINSFNEDPYMTPAQLQPTSPKMGKKEKRKKDNLSPKGSPDAMTQRRKDAPKLPKNVKSGAGLVIETAPQLPPRQEFKNEIPFKGKPAVIPKVIFEPDVSARISSMGGYPVICSFIWCGEEVTDAEHMTKHYVDAHRVSLKSAAIAARMDKNTRDQSVNNFLRLITDKARMFKCGVPNCQQQYRHHETMLKHYESTHGMTSEEDVARQFSKDERKRVRETMDRIEVESGAYFLFCSYRGCHTAGLSQEDMKSHYIVQHKMNMRSALEQSAYDLERRKELIDHMEHEENEDTDTLRQKQ
ncbi:uncharacterized protein LOC142339706 [Convolutriloba macropyga]|uniref:uncharacterized protein LOC142339706 n=1 Tax=Convolutriloba macropyga TaxID=536237 RepID=UPI003F527519